MNIYSMTLEDLMRNANIAKDELLGALERDGLLKSTAEEVGEKYAVILYKPGWLGRLFNRLKGEKDAFRVTVMKVV